MLLTALLRLDVSCATQRELPPAAAQNLATAVSPCLLWGDHVPSRLTEFAQFFVGHLSEPRSQAINVQGC